MDRSSNPAPDRPGTALKIGAVAKETGLSEHTIRVWERRYAAVVPRRTPGGTREYAAEQVERLRALKALTDAGFGIGAIATLPLSRLRELLPARGGAPEDAAAAQLEAFFQALERLDLGEFEALLTRASLAHSPRDLVTRVVAPLTQELGRRWESGQLGIAEEHAASARLRDLLGRQLRGLSAPEGAPRLVAATLSGDRHELGLMMVSVLAAIQGWRVVYLGVDLPLPVLIEATRRARASALLISLVHIEPLSARGMLRELRATLPSSVRIFVGGRAATELALSGIDWPRDLEDFEARMTQLRESAQS